MIKVLVIEDNADVRRAVRAALELHGHEVADTWDGATGLRLAMQTTPALVFCGVSGPCLAWVERLKREPAMQRILVCALVPYDAERFAVLVAGALDKAAQADAAFLEHEALLLSRAMAQSPVSIIITDAKGNIEYVNPHFSTLTGYAASEVLGKNPRVLKSGETPADEYTRMWEEISKGRCWRGIFHNRRKDGRFFWEQATISGVLDEKGGISHYVAVKEDITERHLAEAALLREHHLMDVLMDSIPAHIYFKDLASCFIRVNRAQAALFSVKDPSEVIGKSDFDYFSMEHAQRAYEDEQQIIRTGIPILNKIEKEEWPDRPETWASTTKMPLRDEEGVLIGTFGLSTDITAQKKGEMERLELQMQLHQSQKLESIGRLAAGISHEINTPTQYVSDNLNFFQKAVADIDRVLEAHAALVAWAKSRGIVEPELAEILKRTEKVKAGFLRKELPIAIKDALEGLARVTKIVRAMKNFSHPGVEECTPTDLNLAIESTLIVSRNEWKYVAELVTHFDPALPPVPCLPGEFNQVILNLVVNAAHAIGDALKDKPGGKGVITVSTSVDGDWAEIRIQDTGTGVPESARPHLFEPFFTTKEVGKGTGQGLALARSIIVDRHGGTIRFETELGQGTSFILRLPLFSTPTSKPPPS